MESISLQPAPEAATGYRVHVGRGLGAALAAELSSSPLGARLVLITDETVRPLHAAPLAHRLRASGLQVDLLAIPAGEAHKTRATKADLEDRMVALGVGRDGAILAVGGGVVGDLAGFVAATYHRGIPFVQVPTTLLAMVDASVGGKTGHDVPGGKNLIGAFHHPRSVWADLDLLRTLPEDRIREGLAEVAKCGLVARAELVEHLESRADDLLALRDPALPRAVGDALRIKAAVVSGDPREAGRRAVLNFGHTVGHGLEAASDYRLSHGRAVAIGMAVEADLSVRRGRLSPDSPRRVAGLLGRLGLPDRLPAGLDRDRVLAACRRDKKARAGRIRMVLLAGIGAADRGDGTWTVPVEETELAGALERAS